MTKNTRITRKTMFFMVCESKQETKQKQDKNNANIKTERQKHDTWKQQQKQQKKKKYKHESNLGFKNEMLGKFAWKKQANTEEGKGKKKKDKETKHINVFQTGVDGQKAKKNGVLKRKTKGKPEKTIKMEDFFLDRPFGDTKKKNTLKLQENSLLGFPKKQRKINHQTTKKNLFACWQTPPYCFVFFKLHSFISAKLCFAENTTKKMFSAEHSF